MNHQGHMRMYTPNHIKNLPLPKFHYRDTAMTQMNFGIFDNNRIKLIIAFPYFSGDPKDPPSYKEMAEIIDYCARTKKYLTVGFDAYAYYSAKGNTNVNSRGVSPKNTYFPLT